MRRLVVVAALAACAWPGAALAGNVGQLPDVDVPVAVAPPYNSRGETGEERLPGRVDNTELVQVGVEPGGALRSAASGRGSIFTHVYSLFKEHGLDGSTSVRPQATEALHFSCTKRAARKSKMPLAARKWRNKN